MSELHEVEGRPRCPNHGLVMAPDGRCVLCRREASPDAGVWKPVVIGVALAGALVVGLAELRRSSIASDATTAALDPRVAAEMRRVPVTVYTTRWCGHCNRARAWFAEHDYNVAVHDVEDDEDARRDFLALNPGRVVPTIDVDGEVLVGFSPSDVEQTIRERARERLDP